MPPVAKPRSIVYVILALIAGALAIAGTLTNVLDVTQSMISGGTVLHIRIHMTLWEACAKVRHPSMSFAIQQCYHVDEILTGDSCDVRPRFDAMRAFSILTALAAWLAAVPFAIVDIAHPHCMPPGARRIAMSVAALCLLLFSVVAWAVFISVWELECNGAPVSEEEGAAWGPMAPLMLVVSILALAMGVVAIVVPGATEEDYVDEEAAQQATVTVGTAGYPQQQQHPAVMGQAVHAVPYAPGTAPPNAAAYPPAYQYGYPPQQPGSGVVNAAPIPQHYYPQQPPQPGMYGQAYVMPTPSASTAADQRGEVEMSERPPQQQQQQPQQEPQQHVASFDQPPPKAAS